jgi:hypothetical protein
MYEILEIGTPCIGVSMCCGIGAGVGVGVGVGGCSAEGELDEGLIVMQPAKVRSAARHSEMITGNNFLQFGYLVNGFVTSSSFCLPIEEAK